MSSRFDTLFRYVDYFISNNVFQLPIDIEDILFRIKGGIQLEGIINKTDEEGIKAGFKEAMNDLLSKIDSKAFVLNFLGSPLYMWPKTHASTHPTQLQEETQCKNILNYVTPEVSDLLKKASQQKSLKILPLKIVNMEVQFQIAHLGTVQQMVVQHNKMSRGHFKLTLPIDTLVFAKPEEPLGKLQDQFVESVTTQVSAMSDCIQRYTKGKTVPQPQAFHFELPEKMSLTTVIFPAGVSDEALELQRKELHAKFGLENKPFFRRQMTFDFPDDEAKSTYYKDVHKYIPAPDPNEFKVSLIHGSYTFHHCLQDDENDREWGAPYHCLQVVISWYYLQGYIDTPVPLISEMQEILIKIDEDYTRVVNENAWLKSDEMLAILKYFNISCKTTDIRISAEKEIDLTPHFNEEGTPIVIWKSPVFSEPKAFILLGMAINEDSDTSKVLVLDTMYTRLNDFNWIIDKAIEWKGHEFWEEMEIFALIMPLRPRGI